MLYQARVALRSRHIAMHFFEMFFGDQAASRIDVTTKDRAAELGNGRERACTRMEGGCERASEECLLRERV